MVSSLTALQTPFGVRAPFFFRRYAWLCVLLRCFGSHLSRIWLRQHMFRRSIRISSTLDVQIAPTLSKPGTWLIQLLWEGTVVEAVSYQSPSHPESFVTPSSVAGLVSERTDFKKLFIRRSTRQPLHAFITFGEH